MDLSPFLPLNGGAASGDAKSAVHGAGGIGGLLAMEYTGMPDCIAPPKLLYTYDGNGNVGQLVFFDVGDCPMRSFSDGYIACQYEYDPYGGALLAADNYGVENPFRFSTKYYDAQPSTAAAGERGLYYYGYRYYSPRLGRWANRDPIGERGGILLYGAFLNIPSNRNDPLGLCTVGKKCYGYNVAVVPGYLSPSENTTLVFMIAATSGYLAYEEIKETYKSTPESLVDSGS